jgi:hypothetical protein
MADIFAGRDVFEEETLIRFAHYVKSDPRHEVEIEKLFQKTRDAGLETEIPSDNFALAVSFLQDFEALLAHDTWTDPLEVLDPEKLGPGVRHVGYREMICIGEAHAARAEDPAKILAVKEKIERALARIQTCYKQLDTFLESLNGLESGVAGDLLREAVFRFQRSQKELAGAAS